MYNVVIFSGGTGSKALQEGFSVLYGNDNYNLDIIINAYDNGKSTGDCRKIFESKILGPSDLRKNHLHQYSNLYKNKIKCKNSREAVIYRLFNLRLDGKSKEDYYSQACILLEEVRPIIGDKDVYYLKGLLDYFFFEDVHNRKWRDSLLGVNFHDFALANVFYSSSAAMNNYSLRLAGRDMASFLRIKDNVHLISDVNLYLKAKTESGYVIEDEGDIVEWNNSDDKISSTILLKDGQEYIPSVDEGTDLSEVKSTKHIIENADIIIFSSGTQWSSLIPTYMHSGLRKLLAKSKAKKYLIVNNVEDQDMKGVSGDQTVEILGRYIPIDDITAVVNSDAVESMNHISLIRCITDNLTGENNKHNPVKLVSLIMKDFFGLRQEYNHYIYDLDGTLWDERLNYKGKAVGSENMNLFSGMVHSGNTYEHVRDTFKYLYHREQIVDIFSDFGNVHFTTDNYDKETLTDKYLIEPEVVTELEKCEDFVGKIRMRGEGNVVTIKPLVNRKVLLEEAEKLLQVFNGKYVAKISGYTSIDITNRDYNKKTMLAEIMNRYEMLPDEVVFVGNETIDGAEANIWELGVRSIQVNDVYECNMFLKTLKCLS